MADLGRIGKQLKFDAYLSRGAHEKSARARWIESVLHDLWLNGATFRGVAGGGGMIDKTQMRWQDIGAASTATAFSGPGETHYFRLDAVPLHNCIETMAAARSSTITLYGPQGYYYLSFDFAIDPTRSKEEAALLADPIKRYGVNPWVDRLRLTAGAPIGPQRLDEPPHLYVAAYEEFWHWCSLLCAQTNPLYGIGYSDYDLTQRGLKEYDIYYRTGGEELVGHRVPHLDAFFAHPPARYLSPEIPQETARGISDDILASAAASTVSGVSQRLTNGGILVRPGDPFFSPQAEDAFDMLRRAHQTLERLEALAPKISPASPEEQLRQAQRSVTPQQGAEGQQLGEEAFLAALGARDLFQRIGEERGAEFARVLMNRSLWLQEVLGGAPAAYIEGDD